jgi:hypothetical protein
MASANEPIPGPGDVTPELVTRCLRAAGLVSAEVRALRG